MEIAFILVTLLVAAVVIRYQFGWIRAHNASSGGVKNYNDRMTEFCYSVPMSPEQILDRLEVPNAQDPLTYELRREERKIRFYSPLTLSYSPCSYELILEPEPEGTRLTVRQLNRMPKGKYPYLQNAFWCQKLGAIPIQR